MRGLEIILPWLAGAAGVLALVLLPWGWRGRRVSEHPHCRRCGFDLFGLPPTSRRCSECGADLGKPKAIRSGRRERYRGLVLAGLGLLLACAGFWGYATTQRLRSLPAADKPTWWLLVNAKSKTPAVEQAAMGELLGRYDKHALTPKQTAALIDRLLDIQGRAGVKWSRERSRIIEDARLNGHLSDDKWDRYLRQSVRFTLVLRSSSRLFDALPFAIAMAYLPATSIKADFRIGGLEIAGIPCPVPEKMGRTWSVSADLVKGGFIRLPQDLFARLPSGPNTVKAWLDVDFSYPGKDSNKIERRLRIPVEAQFTLVPAGMQAVMLVAPAEHQAAMRSAVSIRRTGSVRRPQITIEAKSTPVPMAAQVWVRGVDRQRFAGTLCNFSEWPGTRSAVCDLADFDADYVDIVLRPDPELTVETMKVTEIWGQEILLEHVRVR
ncbi:MAG: hypothetical protein ACHRHE_01215 [Tepidisphaerales bacterium]